MSNDEYVEQATTFNPSEVTDLTRLDGTESKREHYRRLSLANRLESNGKWVDRELKTTQDAAAVLDAISSQLELTDIQEDRAFNYLSTIPNDRRQGYRSATIALVLCGIAGREDGREYDPNKLHPENGVEPIPENTFAHLAHDNNVTYTELYLCWKALEADLE